MDRYTVKFFFVVLSSFLSVVDQVLRYSATPRVLKLDATLLLIV